jgi:TPR repeat protein
MKTKLLSLLMIVGALWCAPQASAQQYNWSERKVEYIKATIWKEVFQDKKKYAEHLLKSASMEYTIAYEDYMEMVAEMMAEADTMAYADTVSAYDYYDYADSTAVDSAYAYDYYDYADTTVVDSAYAEDYYAYLDSTAVDTISADYTYVPYDSIYSNEEYAAYLAQKMNDFNELLAKAEAGDTEAQVEVAICYNEGDPIDKDPGKCFYWLDKAIAGGNMKAALYMGLIYGEGYWGEPDYQLAYKYLKMAADSGLYQAKTIIGMFHFVGMCCEEDHEKAIRLWHEAAQNDEKLAKKLLHSVSELEN